MQIFLYCASAAVISSLVVALFLQHKAYKLREDLVRANYAYDALAARTAELHNQINALRATCLQRRLDDLKSAPDKAPRYH